MIEAGCTQALLTSLRLCTDHETMVSATRLHVAEHLFPKSKAGPKRNRGRCRARTAATDSAGPVKIVRAKCSAHVCSVYQSPAHAASPRRISSVFFTPPSPQARMALPLLMFADLPAML